MKWTQQEITLLKQLYKERSLSCTEIGEALGRTKRAICYKASTLRIRYNRKTEQKIEFNPFDQWNISRFVIEEMQKNKNG